MSDPEAAAKTSSSDHEREGRTIAGLARNFEHVKELDADLTKSTGKSAASRSARTAPASATDTAGDSSTAGTATLPANTATNAEHLRRDIAQRLERLMGKGNPPGNAG